MSLNNKHRKIHVSFFPTRIIESSAGIRPSSVTMRTLYINKTFSTLTFTFTMAVLKRAKSLQASALNFLKLWLAKLLSEDSVTESKLDELHAFLSPWLGLVSATLLDEIMCDSELDSIFKINAYKVLFGSTQRRLSFTFLNEQFYTGIVQLLKRRGESLGMCSGRT